MIISKKLPSKFLLQLVAPRDSARKASQSSTTMGSRQSTPEDNSRVNSVKNENGGIHLFEISLHLPTISLVITLMIIIITACCLIHRFKRRLHRSRNKPPHQYPITHSTAPCSPPRYDPWAAQITNYPPQPMIPLTALFNTDRFQEIREESPVKFHPRPREVSRANDPSKEAASKTANATRLGLCQDTEN